MSLFYSHHEWFSNESTLLLNLLCSSDLYELIISLLLSPCIFLQTLCVFDISYDIIHFLETIDVSIIFILPV